MDRPTSDAEIREACPGIRTWLYRDLAQAVARGDVVPLPIAILYETSPGFGHWVALLDTPEGITHFDPYGLRPDDELKWVPKKYREAFAAESPHLVDFLLRVQAYRRATGGDSNVNYSQHRLQARKPWVATCGRWVALRCRNSAMTTDQFAKSVRGTAKDLGVSPDELVVGLVPMPGDKKGRLNGGQRRRFRSRS
jgi:hypothetical protein